jgi:hypothetical protein
VRSRLSATTASVNSIEIVVLLIVKVRNGVDGVLAVGNPAWRFRCWSRNRDRAGRRSLRSIASREKGDA